MNDYQSAPPVAQAKTSTLAAWSLALGITGLVTVVICIGPFICIPAVICGHIAYSRIRKSNGLLSGQGLALTGIITGYIGICTLPILMAIAIPNFVSARAQSQQNACRQHLLLIDAAKTQWALEHNAAPGATPSAADISPYIESKSPGGFDSLICPAGGSYSINSLGARPTCSAPNHTIGAQSYDRTQW